MLDLVRPMKEECRLEEDFCALAWPVQPAGKGRKPGSDTDH